MSDAPYDPGPEALSTDLLHAFLADSAARAAMAARATATCDGRGAMRVLAALT